MKKEVTIVDIQIRKNNIIGSFIHSIFAPKIFSLIILYLEKMCKDAGYTVYKKTIIDVKDVTIDTKLVVFTGNRWSKEFIIKILEQMQHHDIIMGGSVVNVKEIKKLVSTCIHGEISNDFFNVLHDYEKGKLKKEYMFEKKDVLELPILDWSKIKMPLLSRPQIVTSKGCPHKCTFCYVIKYDGNRVRHRPVDEVIEEIKTMKHTFFSFMDDNIIGDVAYAKELFRKMIPLNKRFWAQATVLLGADDELLDLAYKAGLRLVLIGIETPNKEVLIKVKKYQNIHNLEQNILKIKNKGIMIHGGFIIGLENNLKNEIRIINEFTEKTKIDFKILSPIYNGKNIESYNRSLDLTNKIFIRDIFSLKGIKRIYNLPNLRYRVLYILYNLYLYFQYNYIDK